MKKSNSQKVKKSLKDLPPMPQKSDTEQVEAEDEKCELPPKLNKPKKRKNVKCCQRNLAPLPSKPVAPPLPPFMDAVNCELPPKPEKPKKEADKEKVCQRPASYKSPEEKRSYLDNEVVPVLMEGLMAVSRVKPDDPITFLSNFWLKGQHECDKKLPDDLL